MEIKNKIILFNEFLIGSDPFVIKELVIRGYKIKAISSQALDTQINTVEKRETKLERGFQN